MSSFVSVLLAYLLLYKYLTLFLVSYFAALLLPLPSATSLMAAGAFSTQGYFNFYIVFLIGILGNILGDLTGFFIARRYGREFFIKVGLRKFVESPKFIGLENYIRDKAPVTIFCTRFISELGPLVNFIAGLSDITFKKYFIYEASGEFFYVVLYAGLGYSLGSQWQNLSGLVGLGITALVFTIGAFMFSRAYFKELHRKKY